MKFPIYLAVVCSLAAGLAGNAATASGRRAAKPAGSPKPEKPASDISALLASGNYVALQEALEGPLLTAGLPALGRADAQAGLARREFIRACGAEALAKLHQREGGAPFLRALMADVSWIESFLVSDPPKESFTQAAENLHLLHRHGKDLGDPIYRRLATAMALHAGKMNAYLLVQRLGQMQQAHREGLLHVSFDGLNVREMRWAIHLGGNAAEYEYLVNDRQTPLRDYLGACWAVAYRGHNDYGDSIQGPWYHLAFRHGLPGWEAVRAVGGVCGSLSTYGALAAKVHGVPSQTVGQPGHCAYVVRTNDQWPVGNSVTWPTATSSPGWEGTGYATLHQLYEPVSKDGPRLLAANRALWLSRLLVDRERPRADWTAALDQAIKEQPLNYRVWLEYAKSITSAKDTTPTMRLDLARRTAKTFAGYPEAAWALVNRFVEKSLASIALPERKSFLLDLHAELREDRVKNYQDWPFEGSLDWQVSQLGNDPKEQIGYFQKLLEIHGTQAPKRRVFTRVLSWGQEKYARKAKTASHFASAMAGYFKSQGSDGDGAMLRNQVSAGIRAAGETGDIGAFRLWADMRDSLLPAPVPADVSLNPKQAAAFPAIEPFPGEVLSAKGMLTTKTTSKHDRPLSYPALLRANGLGGFFATAAEDAPKAIVELPGEGELSGIVLVDRYEIPAETQWTVPLTVWVSVDGKSWSEVASFTTGQPVYRVDLRQMAPRARFVRLEREAGKKERFQLRNILVFGKPLY